MLSSKYGFTFVTLALLLFVSSSVLADDVVVLTDENFEKEVGHDRDALVEFYAPWCGQCARLAPEYEKLGTSFKKAKSVFIGKVDCDEHNSTCSKYGVSVYPTIQWFPKGSLEPKKYEGEHTAEALTEYVNSDGGIQIQLNSTSSYSAWKAMHPSALDAFDKMITKAKGKNIVMFLDYDGTLSPIVNDPDMAVMSNKMRSAVKEVANLFPTAIVTGRSREKVIEFVNLQNVTYAGSHGMDILPSTSSIMGNEVIPFEPAKEFLPTIQEIKQVLKEKVMAIKGAKVEDNKFCLTVHFRCVNKEDVDTLKEMVESIVKDYPNFHITRGKKVIEIRPSINWDKGHALEYLLNTLGFKNRSDTLPMYIGDDKTDEDAFQVIKRIGRGFPIVVSSIPKETAASYSLRDPDDVMKFLTCLVEWKKKSG